MKLSRNLVAALANSFWSATVGIAVVPLYLKYLGVEAYGLVGFFAMTQALLQTLDFGLAPTLNREAARYSASSNLSGMANLLHTVGRIYWSVAVLVGLLVVLTAPFVAEYWLQPKELDKATVVQALMLIGVIVACRWPVGLYAGVLMGAQRLTMASGISLLMTTVSNFGAVAILAFVSPTIQAFFIWQVFGAVIYVAIVRSATWRVLGFAGRARFDTQELRRIWRFSAGLSGVAVTALIIVHLDRVILSRLLDLESFGRYTMGVLIASSLYFLLTPVFNAVYPRLSALVAMGETARVVELYRHGTRLMLSILFPIAITAAVLAQELIMVWTGDADLAKDVAPIASLFFIGVALNGVMHFPYAVQLAYGMTRLPFMINLVLILFFAPLTVLLALRYGGVGGAVAAATINAVYVVLGTWLTHRKILRGIGAKWLLEDVGIPLGISLLVVAGGLHLARGDPSSVAYNIGIGSALALAAFLAILVASPNLSVVLRRYIMSEPGSVLS